MRTKKIFSLIALMLAATMSLTACGQTASNEANESVAEADANTAEEAVEEVKEEVKEKAAEPVTITYCNFNSSGGNEETLQKMVDAFQQEYPNITVEVETIGYDDYFTQMQTRVAGGTAPDCYELNIENFAAYANKGMLAEISGVDLSGLNETALGAFNVGGKQYGLPEFCDDVDFAGRAAVIHFKDLCTL